MTDEENKTDLKKANEYVEKTGNNDCTIDAFIEGLKTGRHEINAGIELENEKLKAYTIEEGRSPYGEYQYRFRSLFNGCVGQWYMDKELAIEDGEKHQYLLVYAYGDMLKILI